MGPYQRNHGLLRRAVWLFVCVGMCIFICVIFERRHASWWPGPRAQESLTFGLFGIYYYHYNDLLLTTTTTYYYYYYYYYYTY